MIQLPTTNHQLPTVLVVSNGHGEDAAGAMLGRRLQPHAHVTAYPLVGPGSAYLDIPLLEPRRSLPSGGFAARGRGLVGDIRAGALRHWWQQRRTLQSLRAKCDLAIAVGDTFCLWMAAAAHAPVILMATAKSSRHDPHGWLDVAITRRLAARVFARDEDTAAALRARGIHADCLGNPLMDTIGGSASAGARSPDRLVATLLPGSRTDAYANLADLMRLAVVVGQAVPVTWLCPLAPSIDRERVETAAEAAGWTRDHTGLMRGATTVALTGDFGGAIRDADVVIALAGTASEQAAGIGRPVVAFPGTGAQVTPRFLSLQAKLLTDALVVTGSWTEAAGVVLRLLRSPDERLRRGAIGRIRMGPPGAIQRIVESILGMLGAGSSDS